MTGAPRPQTAAYKEAVSAGKRVMTLTIKGETHRLAVDNIPLKEKLICRKATGLPFEAFVAGDVIGEDTLAVLWWLAKRADTDPMLTLTQVEESWPTGLGPDDIDVEISDPDGDDPEA